MDSEAFTKAEPKISRSHADSILVAHDQYLSNFLEDHPEQGRDIDTAVLFGWLGY